MDKERLLQKFDAFMRSLTKEDKIAVHFHADADGVSSGVIVAKTIERLRGKKVDLVFYQEPYWVTDETIEKLQKNNITKYIIVDQSVDERPEQIKKVELFAKILILDHHSYKTDLNSEKTLFVHADKISSLLPVRYPVAKLSFDVCKRVKNIDDLDWVSCFGLIGDVGYNYWKEFVDDSLKKYGFQITNEGPSSAFGKITKLVTAAKCYKTEKVVECFEVIYAATTPKDVINSPLRKYQAAINEEIQYWLKQRHNAEVHGDLIIMEINPKYQIYSPFTTVLSMEYFPKSATVIVISDTGGKDLNISGRRQDGKFKVNELLKEAAKSVGGNGGGHPIAAGGQIPKEKKKLFKEALIKLYEGMKKA
ncbi:DHH family phosphoesterase [Candidatus Woesearchaeota archaeon]|nr:DHH family phosphoesterase [Candidatus Woesearchaeota archaeon]